MITQTLHITIVGLISAMHIQTLIGFNNMELTKKETNKNIPAVISTEVKKALSFYPDLKDVDIEFVIKQHMKKSFMKAQPKFWSLFTTKQNRKYRILVSDKFSLDNKKLELSAIPSRVLVGWFGHELGHIKDYRERSTLNLIWFGLRYFFSDNYIRKAERAADSYAVSHGMKEYLLETKNFILNHTDLSDKYKARIKRLYVSPDELLKIIEDQELGKLSI